MFDRKRYQGKRKEIIARKIFLRKQKKEWLISYKKTLKCKLCSENHISCLQFHHRDSKIKLYNISNMLRDSHAIKNILKEIEKCDILCANCHFKLHWKEIHLENTDDII